MKGKIALITGANAGIGKATALGLAGRGARVVMVCRSRERGEAARSEVARKTGGEVDLLIADLSSQREVRLLAGTIMETYPRLDVLILNAGVFTKVRQETEDGLELQFGVNHAAPYLLARLILDLLRRSVPSRIVVVSSDAHRQGSLDFDDLQLTTGYGGWQAYARSKLANIYFTRELARRLEGSGVTVNAVHPGVVATGFARDGDTKGLFSWLMTLTRPFYRSPEKGARTSIFVASSAELDGVTGKYFANSKEARPTSIAQDDEAARRLWTASEELIAQADA
ncbi:MAG: SDR family oxidoreductase [Chloroflexi bacterium]|nr:SDR family oxidoreductase [Chloroflexota bacterium]